MKDVVVAYLKTFSEYGSSIEDDVAEYVNNIVVSAIDQIDKIVPHPIAPINIAVAVPDELGGLSASVEGLMVKAAIEKLSFGCRKDDRGHSSVSVPIASIGAIPYAGPAISFVESVGAPRVNQPAGVANSVATLLVTCATDKFAHVCRITQTNGRKYSVIGSDVKSGPSKYADAETQAGAELLDRDSGNRIEKDLLVELMRLPEFADLHPKTGNSSVIITPKFQVNEQILSGSGSGYATAKGLSQNPASRVEFELAVVPRDGVRKYLSDWADKHRSQRHSARLATMVLAEMTRLLLAIKPLADNQNRVLIVGEFVRLVHEKIARTCVEKSIELKDLLRFVSVAAEKCWGTGVDDQNPQSVLLTTIDVRPVSRDDLSKDNRDGIVNVVSGVGVVASGIAQLAYKIVHKKFGILPKLESIDYREPALTLGEEKLENSFSKVVEVVERNNARLAICCDMLERGSTRGVVLVTASVDKNRQVYDALDKGAVLVKSPRAWWFALLENVNVLKKSLSINWLEVLSEAQGEAHTVLLSSTVYGATAPLSANYIENCPDGGMSRTWVRQARVSEDPITIATTIAGNSLVQAASVGARVKFQEYLKTGTPDTWELGFFDDGSESELCRHYHTSNPTTLGFPTNWLTDLFAYRDSGYRKLLSSHHPMSIAVLSSQQLGLVTVRMVTQQVATETTTVAARAFNRGLLRLVTSGKEFKFALNPSSMEMIVRNDEIVFGGRRIKSHLVTPAPSLPIVSSMFHYKISSNYNNRVQTRADREARIKSLESPDTAVREEAMREIRNDRILADFLLASIDKGIPAKNADMLQSGPRCLFFPKYVGIGDNDEISMFGFTATNPGKYDIARISMLYNGSFMSRSRPGKTISDLVASTQPLFFDAGSDVEELFDFNELVAKVVNMALSPELQIGPICSLSEIKQAHIRYKELSRDSWLVDELIIGDVKVSVTVTTSSKGKLSSTRYFVNGHQIKAAELVKVVNMATCFQDTDSYTEAVAQISEVSLAAREILQNGFLVDVGTSNACVRSKIMLEIDRVKSKWVLVVRDKDGEVKKTLHVPGGVTRFTSTAPLGKRRKRREMSAEAFGALIGDIPGLEFVDIKRIHENGFSRYNEIIARSRKFLEDVIKMIGASYGTFKVGRGSVSGYSVKGISGRSYVVACSDMAKDKPFENDHGTEKFGAIYSIETGEYVCVVDKSNEQSGYDVIANRLLAMANDMALVDQIHTLEKFVN